MSLVLFVHDGKVIHKGWDLITPGVGEGICLLLDPVPESDEGEAKEPKVYLPADMIRTYWRVGNMMMESSEKGETTFLFIEVFPAEKEFDWITPSVRKEAEVEVQREIGRMTQIAKPHLFN